MPRLTSIAVILLSLALCSCQSAALKSPGSQSNNAGLTEAAPANGAQVASPGNATPTAGTPANSSAGGTSNNSGPTLSSAIAAVGDISSPAFAPFIAWVRKPNAVLYACLGVFAFGYLLLQIYAGAAMVGRRKPATGFFGHLFTGFLFMFVRLFDNVLRFVISELTRRPQGSVSLLTGVPNPNVIYDPRRPEPSPATALQSPRPQALGLGTGLPARGGAGRIGLMQDVRGTSDSSSGLGTEKLVAAGSNRNS